MRRRLRAAAHEIRTPLAGAATIVDLLSASELTHGPTRDYVRLLKDAIDQLVAISTDMLDLGRVEADLGLGPRDSFSPAALLSSVAETARLRAARQGVEVTLALESLPESVLGHPVMLRRVVENLLDNALKHTEAGTVRVAAQGVESRQIRVTVANPGPTIPAEDLASIFEPYVQLASGERAGGTGLGLALVKAAVLRLGGDVSVESMEGETRFSVTIPVSVPEPLLEPVRPDIAPRRPLDILVAEDNPVNRIVAGTVLGEFGHRVAFAADGRAAVSALERSAFDLVLMDIEMPGLDGIAALGAIRRMPGAAGSTPVVALSARGEDGRAEILAGGFDGYVTKPIDPAALFTTIEAATAGAGQG
jgi:CheY-like chemotaxis protein